MAEARVNGVRLYYALRGQGEPLVCIHGLQGDSSHFRSFLPALSASYRLLLFDQRGSGHSDKPAMDYSTALLADDTAALMEAVGFSAAHIFGVSMGGMIAQELALRHPQRVQTLTLGCTHAGGSHVIRGQDDVTEAAYAPRAMSAQERASALAHAALSAEYLQSHPEIIEELAAARQERPIDPAALARRRAAVQQHDTADRLSRISCPTLVITGKQDKIVSWENSQLLARAIPHATLHVLETPGHLFWVECLEETIRILVGFLSQSRSGLTV